MREGEGSKAGSLSKMAAASSGTMPLFIAKSTTLASIKPMLIVATCFGEGGAEMPPADADADTDTEARASPFVPPRVPYACTRDPCPPSPLELMEGIALMEWMELMASPAPSLCAPYAYGAK